MKKRLGYLVGVVLMDTLFLTLAFCAGYYVRSAAVGAPGLRLPILGSESADHYPLLAEVRELMETRFIRPLPDDRTLEYGAVRGWVAAVGDPYTVFVEPQAHELDTQSLQGEFGGIGVELAQNAAGEIILSPYPDPPAARAGLLDGDVLLAVDHTPVEIGMSLDQAAAAVRGPVGTAVTIKVRHTTGVELTAEIVRERIQLPSVVWKMVEGQATIGLLAVSRFSDKTPEEVERAIEGLARQGASRYILDLRNNGGGILESGVEVASKFLDGGVVMYESQRDAPEKVYTAPSSNTLAVSAPLAVLVNHNTASAAEIVAGALLDRQRAALIGQQTYGKGSVQLVYELSDGSSLHVTAYLWYTPDRRLLHGEGLPPTFAVEPASDGADAELAYAVEYLRGLP